MENMTKEQRLKRSIERMKFMVGESRTPIIIIANEAEIILRYFYGGFWKAILNMIWHRWTGSYFYYRFIYSVLHRKELKEIEKDIEEMEKEIEKDLEEALGLLPNVSYKLQDGTKWVS